MIGEKVSHYTIQSKLGEGGMGVVFQARDINLDRVVALKFLPPRALADDEAKARFLQEARATAALNHPNIATIYGIEESEERAFIAMEYVEGRTLKKKILIGEMSLEEILDIAVQIAEGLKAAHEKDVIHRDIKSSNVMVTPKGRAKLMDFGLAKVAGSHSLTKTGSTPGTVSYMSPEQAMGEGIDHRSDIWALGVVLYEMLTGRLPFFADVQQAVIYQIVNKEPPPPSELRDDTPEELERIVLRAMTKDVSQRYQRAEEMLADLKSLRGPSEVALAAILESGRKPRLLASSARRRVAVGALAAVLAVAAVTSTLVLRGSADGPRGVGSEVEPLIAGTVVPRRSVAVLGFKNLSGRDDVAWVSTALAEMLTTELAAEEVVRTIPGEVVSRMKMELSLPDAVSFGEETLQQIRRYLGADVVVLGSYLTLGDENEGSIRLDLRVQDAAAGVTLASLAETGDEAQLFELVSRTGARLREELGAGPITEATLIALAVAWPANNRAARLYAEGLEKLRIFDAPAAHDLLAAAVEEDPDFPLAHSALAEAWKKLGYDINAREEAERAHDLSAELPEELRQLVEARYREANNDWARAIEIYGELWELYPDNFEYGLALAGSQTTAGKLTDASTTIDALHRLPPPAALDARIDLAEAHVAEGLADYERQQAACIAARTKAVEQGATLLVGRSWHMEGRSLYYQNQHERAFAAFEEGKRIFEQADHPAEIANALNAIGIMNRVVGNREAAVQDYEQALALKRQVGEQNGIAMVLSNLGIVVEARGDLVRARSLHEESEAIYRELGNRRSLVNTLINLGNVNKRLGNFERSRALYEEVATVALELENKYTHALALNNLSGVLHTMGELEESRARRAESLAIFEEIGHKLMISYALYGLGEIFKDGDDLVAARAMHDSSLAIREELKLGVAVGSRRAIARIMLAEERFAEAEEWIRRSDEELSDKMTDVDNAHSQALLAKALAGRGRLAEAGPLVERARSQFGKGPDVENRLQVEIIAAEVSAASGETGAARELLRSVLEEASRTGYVPIALEARLALGRIELSSGDAAAARADLTALQAEASEKGFDLVARKAAGAAGNDPR